MSRRIAVVGAGIGGLAVAHELLRLGEESDEALELTCLDAADRAGGHLRTTRDRGFLYEWAATGYLDDASTTRTLVGRLGLDRRVVQARQAATRRYVFARGKLRELRPSPASFVTSGLISPLGLMRLACEPWVRQRDAKAGDETVFDFAARRIGREPAAVLIDALTTGIFAGDARSLSLGATFPKMREMESRYGGLFRALWSRRREARAAGDTAPSPAGPGGRMTSFKDGMQELTDTLASTLGQRLQLGTKVESVSSLGHRGFRLLLRDGAPIETDAVVLACPARVVAGMVAEMDPTLSSALASIRSAPVAVVHFGYRRDALPTRPDGFGYLAPRNQGVRSLGTLWPSDFFEGRAPEGSQLLSTMIGGAHDPAAVEFDDATLATQVREDLRLTMGIRPEPYFARVVRNLGGIPQYELGHLDRVASAEQRLAATDGLWIAGNALHGVSVNHCIAKAADVAKQAFAFLESPATAGAT